MTVAWRGTSRERLYRELGWEDLYHRRWYRRLCHFYNLIKSRSPNYLFAEIPPECNVSYHLRNIRSYDQNVGRTARYSNTYCQNAPFEWNLLDDDTKNSTSVSEFKRKLLAMIRPIKNSIFGINDIVGVRHLSKLRLHFSRLNEHRLRQNFDCLAPVCLCGIANEDSEHFLLHCPFFEECAKRSPWQLIGYSCVGYSRAGRAILMPYNTVWKSRSDPNCKQNDNGGNG